MPDLIAALEAVTGRPYVPPPTPRHPETGHACADCRKRDDYLEDLAERRAEERRGY